VANDDIDLEDSSSSNVAAADEILKYSDNKKEFNIIFDEDDITVAPNESVNISGDIHITNAGIIEKGDFELNYLIDDVPKGTVSLNKGHLAFNENLDLAASSTPYKISFTPVENDDYFVEFCEAVEGELSDSWVYVTVTAPVVDDSNICGFQL
jgi:hypothetical protein